jgi:hypothetical protein
MDIGVPCEGYFRYFAVSRLGVQYCMGKSLTPEWDIICQWVIGITMLGHGHILKKIHSINYFSKLVARSV